MMRARLCFHKCDFPSLIFAVGLSAMAMMSFLSFGSGSLAVPPLTTLTSCERTGTAKNAMLKTAIKICFINYLVLFLPGISVHQIAKASRRRELKFNAVLPLFVSGYRGSFALQS